MELVLQAVSLAPRVQVDAVVEALIRHGLIGGDVLVPVGAVANEVVEDALREFHALGRDAVGADEGGREAEHPKGIFR